MESLVLDIVDCEASKGAEGGNSSCVMGDPDSNKTRLRSGTGRAVSLYCSSSNIKTQIPPNLDRCLCSIYNFYPANHHKILIILHQHNMHFQPYFAIVATTLSFIAAPSYAAMTADDIVNTFQNGTTEAKSLQGHANSINIVNAPLAAIGRGPYPVRLLRQHVLKPGMVEWYANHLV